MLTFATLFEIGIAASPQPGMPPMDPAGLQGSPGGMSPPQPFMPQNPNMIPKEQAVQLSPQQQMMQAAQQQDQKDQADEIQAGQIDAAGDEKIRLATEEQQRAQTTKESSDKHAATAVGFSQQGQQLKQKAAALKQKSKAAQKINTKIQQAAQPTM